jgi:5,10-methylenetetrahydromethanopterin reductase
MRRLGLGFCGQPYPIREILAAAQLAERQGFESVWISEDIWTGKDAISILTSLALSTERVKLGTAVINIYTRHPILTAQTFNALSELAPGRFILGIGAGTTWKPFLADLGDRLHPLRDMRRAVETIRNLMSGKETRWGEGTVNLTVSRQCFGGAVSPHQQGLPIYMGAVGPRMTELAGEIADGLMLELAVWQEDVPLRLQQAALGAVHGGKDVRSLDIVGLVLISANEYGKIHPNALGYAIKTVAMLTDEAVQHYGFDPQLVRRIREAYFQGDCNLAGRLITSEMVSSFIAAGTQENCLRFIEGIVGAGVKLPVLLPFGGDIHPVIEVGAEFLRRQGI